MKKNEDIIIITWRFCKNKQFYHLSEVRDYLESLKYQKDIIDFAVSLANESSYELKDKRLSLKADSYINLLNYDEVLFAKKSVKIARWSIWIAIIFSLSSIAFEFIDIEPVFKYNFWNIKIEEKNK